MINSQLDIAIQIAYLIYVFLFMYLLDMSEMHVSNI